MDRKQQAVVLHRWYGNKHQARRLPWRRPDEPSCCVCMVEGLLAQTRADAVAEHYERIFADVREYRDWLDLPQDERVERVVPLGLPRLKEAAVSSIAAALVERITNADFSDPLFVMTLQSMHGVGPYTAAMIGVLFGGDAVPIDTNVDRVGSRVAADGDAHRWMADIIEGCRGRSPKTGYHPFYEVTCAVLDLGATLCGAHDVRCGWCPVVAGCAHAGHHGVQGTLFGDVGAALEDTQRF